MEIQQETPELIQSLEGLCLMEETMLEELSDKKGAAKTKGSRTHCPSPPVLAIASLRGWTIKASEVIGNQKTRKREVWSEFKVFSECLFIYLLMPKSIIKTYANWQ